MRTDIARDINEQSLRARIAARGRHFVAAPWGGGVVLVVFVAVALVLANLDATREAYHNFLTTPLSIAIGDKGSIFSFTLDIEKFINDGLMVVFFFVVGLEIKRELLVGRLSSVKQAVLPMIAALGGMAVPALIYAAFNHGTEFSPGWGIPMATDIAFAVAILSLMGNKVPVVLKVFLTALAIVDDLGAIVVIAIFYTYKINWMCLGLIAVLMLGLWIMRRAGVTRVFPYLAMAVAVWFLFYLSGVHATISGVLMAMLIPTKPLLSKKMFLYRQNQIVEEFRFHDRAEVGVLQNEEQHMALLRLRSAATDAIGMSQRMEHVLNPYVTFIVLPVFALGNAGVAFTDGIFSVLASPLGMGIFCGLVLGKPVGIFLAGWLAVKLRIAILPRGVHWLPFFGVVCTGGVGFTMSIFIDTLAFAGSPEVINQGKIAIFMASIAAALLGWGVISLFGRLRTRNKNIFLKQKVNNVTKND